VEVNLHILLTSVLDGEWSDSRSRRFIPDKRAYGKTLVGPTASVDVEVKRNILASTGTELWLFNPLVILSG
jgi:hypothetical protein